MKRLIVNRLVVAGLSAAALIMIALVPPARGATVWSIDPHHSSITFFVNHIQAAVPGALLDYQGKIVFDPADLANSYFDLYIFADSIDTRIRQRDRHLRSADFLDVCKFPMIRFKTDSIRAGETEGQFTALGKLTIKDRTKDLAVPFTFHPTKPDPLNKGRGVAGITARFSLDRLDFGVGSGRFSQMGVIGRRVDAAVNFELIP